jgi:hypothetical protein
MNKEIDKPQSIMGRSGSVNININKVAALTSSDIIDATPGKYVLIKTF